MLVEDTIESQEGLTFFVFFNTLFLFLRPQNSSHERKEIKIKYQEYNSLEDLDEIDKNLLAKLKAVLKAYAPILILRLECCFIRKWRNYL